MKKVISGFIGSAIVAGGLFYVGSESLMAGELQKHMLLLQNNGFAVEDRVQDSNGEHFVLSLDDLQKVAHYFPEYEKVLLSGDKSALKEFKFKVDLTTSGSEISADIYPISLPMKDFSSEKKKVIQKYIDEKTLLVHLDYDGLSDSFEGRLKNINENIDNVDFLLNGFSFSGNNDSDKVSIKYNIDKIKITNQDRGFVAFLDGTSSDMVYSGVGHDITNGSAKVDKISFEQKGKYFTLKDLKLNLSSEKNNNLLDISEDITISTIQVNADDKKIDMEDLSLNLGWKNIDLEAYEKLVKLLEKTNPNNKPKELEKYLGLLLSKGFIFNIDEFGVKKITNDGEDFGNFSLSTSVLFKENLQLNQSANMPMFLNALNYVDIKSKIKFSDLFYDKLLKSPKGRMLGFIKPVSESGNKVYNVVVKDGKVEVNGNPM